LAEQEQSNAQNDSGCALAGLIAGLGEDAGACAAHGSEQGL